MRHYTSDFINRADLYIEMAGHRIPCQSGLHLGSRYVGDPEQRKIFEYLPESMLTMVVNRQDFARILAFDKWLRTL